jgi:hypothetical protein
MLGTYDHWELVVLLVENSWQVMFCTTDQFLPFNHDEISPCHMHALSFVALYNFNLYSYNNNNNNINNKTLYTMS